jgi:hypothetical protein
MIKKFLPLLFWLCSISFFSAAQHAEDSIRQVISRMFTGMKESDTAMLRSCFSSTAALQTFVRTREGITQVKTDQVSDFCKSIASLPKGAADERIVFKDMWIDGDLAAVWTPYQFFFNGNFSHCGVNSFQMARLNGQWKIQYIIDTRRKDNCPE